MPAKDDGKPIVVIGAGSTGSSTAYHLAKAGQRVILVERGQIGSGMTSRSSAIVRTHYSNEIVARMALYSLGVIRDFSSVGDSGFVKTGLLILAPSDLREGVVANVKMLNGIGARNEVIERKDAERMFPEISYEDCDYIVFEPESGYADSVGVANAYARSAESLGARLMLGTQAVKLNLTGGAVESIQLADGTALPCSKVILCTNVWTNGLLTNSTDADIRPSFPLWTIAHPIVSFNRPPQLQGKKPVIWDYPGKTYYKPEGQSLFFVGSLDPALDNQEIEPEACPQSVSYEFISSFSEAVVKRIPSMAEGVLHSNYVGMYDSTPDQHPIIDELSELGMKGVYCCVGMNGHGFKLSPALGLMNAEMLLDRKGIFGTSFDRSPFSLSRFKAGRLMKTKYASLATVA